MLGVFYVVVVVIKLSDSSEFTYYSKTPKTGVCLIPPHN